MNRDSVRRSNAGINTSFEYASRIKFVQRILVVRFTDIVSVCIMLKWNLRSVNGYDGLNSSKSTAMPASYA
jgi:hypothetical protein